MDRGLAIGYYVRALRERYPEIPSWPLDWFMAEIRRQRQVRREWSAIVNRAHEEEL